MQANDKIPADEMKLAEKLAKYQRTVLAKNARFQAMTPPQQRVAIAKDVLEWLRAGKIHAVVNCYYLPGPGADSTVNGGSCKACALGAMLACHVETLPGASLENMEWQGVVPARAQLSHTLENYFTQEQLTMIEVAYECNANCLDAALHAPSAARDAAFYFGNHYFKDHERMVAIMKNIVANGGTFVP